MVVLRNRNTVKRDAVDLVGEAGLDRRSFEGRQEQWAVGNSKAAASNIRAGNEKFH